MCTLILLLQIPQYSFPLNTVSSLAFLFSFLLFLMELDFEEFFSCTFSNVSKRDNCFMGIFCYCQCSSSSLSLFFLQINAFWFLPWIGVPVYTILSTYHIVCRNQALMKAHFHQLSLQTSYNRLLYILSFQTNSFEISSVLNPFKYASKFLLRWKAVFSSTYNSSYSIFIFSCCLAIRGRTTDESALFWSSSDESLILSLKCLLHKFSFTIFFKITSKEIYWDLPCERYQVVINRNKSYSKKRKYLFNEVSKLRIISSKAG